MEPFRLVLAVGDFGGRVLAHRLDRIDRRRDYWGEPTEIVHLTPASIPDGGTETPASRREWRRWLSPRAPALYELLKSAVQRCIDRTQSFAKRPKTRGPEPTIRATVVASMADPFAGAILVDVAHLLGAACAPRPVDIVALLGAATFSVEAEAERAEKLNLWAALSETYAFTRRGTADLPCAYGPLVPVVPRERLFDLCFAIFPECSAGSFVDDGTMAGAVARFLNVLTTTRARQQMARPLEAVGFGLPGSDREPFSALGLAVLGVPVERVRLLCVSRLGAEMASRWLRRRSPAAEIAKEAARTFAAWKLDPRALAAVLSKGGDIAVPVVPPGLSSTAPLAAFERKARGRLDASLKRIERVASGLSRKLEPLPGAVAAKRTSPSEARALLAALAALVAKARERIRDDEGPDGVEAARRDVDRALAKRRDAGVIDRTVFARRLDREVAAAANRWRAAMQASLRESRRRGLARRVREILDGVAGSVAAIERRLAQHEEALERAAALFAEPALDAPPFYESSALTDGEIEEAWKRFSLASSGSGERDKILARFVAEFRPFDAPADPSGRTLFDLLSKFAERRFDAHELSVEEILLDAKHEAGRKRPEDHVESLLRRADPLYPGAGVAPGSCAVDLLEVESRSGFRHRFAAMKDRAEILVSSRDPLEIASFRTVHGLGLEGNAYAENYRRAWEAAPQDARTGAMVFARELYEGPAPPLERPAARP